MSPKRRLEDQSEVETGLGSMGRIRLIRILTEHPNQQYTKYTLAKTTGLNSKEIRRQIQTLVDLGWVKEFSPEPKTYTANMENRIVKLAAEFFHRLKLG